MTNERVAVFVDGTNLTKGLKNCFNITRLDICAFSKYLARDRKLVAIYYAEAPYVRFRGKNNFEQQQVYLNMVKKNKGVIYRKGHYNTWTKPPTEKLTDVHLAVDMVDLCHRNEFDTAFLISGDTDLCPAVDVLIREGKKVVIVYFDNPKRNAFALRKHALGNFKNITRKIAEEFKWEHKKEPEPR